MHLNNRQRWLRTIAWLRRNHPTRYPVTVRSVNIIDQAECTLRTRRFWIIVDSDRCMALRIDSLLHEWAHALTWWGTDADDHGPEWGLTYARLYREWLAWDWELGSGASPSAQPT